MSTINVDVPKVRAVSKAVVERVVDLGRTHNLHPAEIILGIAEALGRSIAAQEGSHLVHSQWMETAINHMATTVRTAMSTRGQNPDLLQ